MAQQLDQGIIKNIMVNFRRIFLFIVDMINKKLFGVIRSEPQKDKQQ